MSTDGKLQVSFQSSDSEGGLGVSRRMVRNGRHGRWLLQLAQDCPGQSIHAVGANVGKNDDAGPPVFSKARVTGRATHLTIVPDNRSEALAWRSNPVHADGETVFLMKQLAMGRTDCPAKRACWMHVQFEIFQHVGDGG